MKSYHEALKLIIGTRMPRFPERVSVTGSIGRITYSDVYSRLDFPTENNSAMDGYAINSALTEKISTGGLALDIEESVIYAGVNFNKEIDAGKAIKIMTGGYIPPGLDAVVPWEKVEIKDKKLFVNNRIKPGKNIRKKGEDIKKGDKVVNKGTMLTPERIALMVSCNVKTVSVYKKPVVYIISTGSEIIGTDRKYRYGKTFNSNGVLAGLFCEKNGCSVSGNSISRDILSHIKKEVEIAIGSGDFIITSAGASYGEKDYTEKALMHFGLKIKFREVNIRPGKPFSFGLIDKIPVFMLPGNPVAFFTCLEVFVKPFLRNYYGVGSTGIVRTEARFDYDKNNSKTEFVPANTVLDDGCYFSDIIKKKGPAMISVFDRANSLIELPENCNGINRGEFITANIF